MAKPEKVCLIVIDGWGLSDKKHGNAIANAKTPVMDELSQVDEKFVTLDASGEAVGLPAGLMGNSEVGHLNIGAGRVMYQDILRINKDCREGKLIANENFVQACKRAIGSNGRLHLLGLVSDGGVHAHIEHLFAILDCAQKLQVPNVYIHFFADGRDTLPKSGVKYLENLLEKLKNLQNAKLSSIMGRYYAMDRDKRWDRIKIAYDALVGDANCGEWIDSNQVIAKVNQRYEVNNETDEFLKPILIRYDDEKEKYLIKDDDTLLFFNFRADRMRQIVETFAFNSGLMSSDDQQKQEIFSKFKKLKNIEIYTMNQYKKEFPLKMLYPPYKPKNVLAEAIANNGIAQFHCAETEKYAHVTFFFNGGREQEFEREDRKMVQSPKVATYDLEPVMNAHGVAHEMCVAIESNKYHFVMCNFAPPDMVGHTGKYEPTVRACEATDSAIGKIVQHCRKYDYACLITSDHGNAERMIDEVTGGPITSHTTNRVPFIMTNTLRNFDPKIINAIKIKNTTAPNPNPALCDVAPTILDIMHLQKPQEMDGKSLLI